MKAISLLQPWASLVVLGLKKIETRSFDTKIRGRVLIHASAGKPPKALKKTVEGWVDQFGIPALTEDNYPLGAILGSVEITKTAPTWQAKESGIVTPMEEAFGDYGAGRYGWRLMDPVKFEMPVPAKGDLGFWNTLNRKAFEISERTPEGFFVSYYGKQILTPYSIIIAGELISGIIKNKSESYLYPKLQRIENALFQAGHKGPYSSHPGFCEWCGVHPCKC